LAPDGAVGLESEKLLILAPASETIRELIGGLTRKGFACDLISHEAGLADYKSISLLLVDNTYGLPDSELTDMLHTIKRDRHAGIILLTDIRALPGIEKEPDIDDFILKPVNLDEVIVRIQRLRQGKKQREESSDFLKSGDLTLDLPRCEVAVAGSVIDLTFTEYELLKLLMSQKGSVFSREILLNKIWGYDYFGGDRTVDVHITRLRSKIENANQTYIETVRNIGYRFKADDKLKTGWP
jgi:two-component system, OmpR family, alkaline phosphatase synthesis response regulator PhoP